MLNIIYKYELFTYLWKSYSNSVVVDVAMVECWSKMYHTEHSIKCLTCWYTLCACERTLTWVTCKRCLQISTFWGSRICIGNKNEVLTLWCGTQLWELAPGDKILILLPILSSNYSQTDKVTWRVREADYEVRWMDRDDALQIDHLNLLKPWREAGRVALVIVVPKRMMLGPKVNKKCGLIHPGPQCRPPLNISESTGCHVAEGIFRCIFTSTWLHWPHGTWYWNSSKCGWFLSTISLSHTEAEEFGKCWLT